MVDMQDNGPHPGAMFDLDRPDAYRRWRETKLEGYPRSAAELSVTIADPRALSAAEKAELLRLCAKANMAVYSAPADTGKDAVQALGAQLGLRHLDANLCADEDDITSLQVVEEGRHKGYIPYSNRPLQWHTDGYYNPGGRQIRGMVLHCARPAAEGGENELMDPEIVYILLRDRDVAHIRALMEADAMTIPANYEDGKEIRPAHSGPVFSVDAASGSLHMRYTARKRNIVWKNSPEVTAAVAALEEILAGDSPYRFRHRLEAGQGVVNNNVLHSSER